MDTTQRRFSDQGTRFVRVCFGFFAALVALNVSAAVNATEIPMDRHGLHYFRDHMWRTVRADHPAVVPVVAAIRAITQDPLQQLVIVNDVAHLLVDYDDDMRAYGAEDFHATLDEMLVRRRTAGWAYMRDDCDGRAVFAAHILAGLGIPWRLEASYWKEHAWIVARVNGREYDLLDLRKNARETDKLSYKLVGRFFVRPSNPPPPFSWREAWAGRTHRNLKIGQTLGMLTLDSTEAAMHRRHATDWTKKSPASTLPPLDDARTLMAGVAAFPHGESLRIAALADAQPAPQPANGGVALGGATNANTTAAPAASPAK